MKLRTHALWGLLAALSLSGLAVLEAPVADAAMRGDVLEVQALLRSGEDVNAAQGDGMTALHWAAELGRADLAETLIAAGAYLCLLYTSPSPRDKRQSRMPSSA